MAWNNSKVFRSFLAERMRNGNAADLDGGSFKAALFNNAITPDQNATAALSTYNAATSQWVTANEVIDSTGGTDWPAGGRPLGSLVINDGSAGVVFWDAADVVSGTTADLANATGTLVYESALGIGVCYNYFGGANSVVNGTFTIIWAANGIWRATL